MPGTVNAIIPLSLLEAVRSVDIPEGDDIDVEYVQEHRNKRLGLSDTVIAQIRRYKEALKRNQPIAIDEASGIARLIGRRPDAEGIFTRAGGILANRMYQMISATRRQIIHLLPAFLARPLAPCMWPACRCWWRNLRPTSAKKSVSCLRACSA